MPTIGVRRTLVKGTKLYSSPIHVLIPTGHPAWSMGCALSPGDQTNVIFWTDGPVEAFKIVDGALSARCVYMWSHDAPISAAAVAAEKERNVQETKLKPFIQRTRSPEGRRDPWFRVSIKNKNDAAVRDVRLVVASGKTITFDEIGPRKTVDRRVLLGKGDNQKRAVVVLAGSSMSRRIAAAEVEFPPEAKTVAGGERK